jgi:hypothetical protein
MRFSRAVLRFATSELFSCRQQARRRDLSAAVLFVNKKWGSEAIAPGLHDATLVESAAMKTVLTNSLATPSRVVLCAATAKTFDEFSVMPILRHVDLPALAQRLHLWFGDLNVK